jgi:hypothetical protein
VTGEDEFELPGEQEHARLAKDNNNDSKETLVIVKRSRDADIEEQEYADNQSAWCMIN